MWFVFCIVFVMRQMGRYDKINAKVCQKSREFISGFKDADRTNPPAIGSTITYKYRGYTQKGLPRFATYLRKRK